VSGFIDLAFLLIRYNAQVFISLCNLYKGIAG
jgi:hypothetical protein